MDEKSKHPWLIVGKGGVIIAGQNAKEEPKKEKKDNKKGDKK